MANPDLAFGALAKLSRFHRDVQKHASKVDKAREKRLAQKAVADAWELVRRQVHLRDDGKCRVCFRPVELRSDNPLNFQHTHHIVYRSAGGSDELSNLITLCGKCHADEHEHRIRIWGDGNATIAVDVFNLETGKVERHFEREVPA